VSLRHIAFRQLGTSEIHLRYLEEDPDLETCLGRRARDAAELLRRAPGAARRLVAPAALSESLLAYAQRHGAPQPVLENARAVAAGDAFMVVAGQQPGLFGGPLFTVHKAATAVRLARELSATRSGPRVVPIFWNHTDDHDLDEVNRAFFVNANQDVQRVRLDLHRTGESIRDVPVGHAMDKALAAIDDLLPHTEFRDQTIEIFRPRHPDESFGAATARLLFSMFGEDGLLVIEPRDLPAESFSVLTRWWDARAAIGKVIGDALEHLNDVGADIAVDPNATLMFHRSGSQRLALADGDAMPRANDLSPGVLLRPLWQDACLPTIGSVVGPGELAYLAVAGPLYRHLGVPAPVLVPRASLTMVEPSLAKLLRRFDLDIADLGEEPQVLAEKLSSSEQEAPEDAIDELAQDVKRRLGETTARVREVDNQMVGAVERLRKKTVEDLTKLAERMRRSRQNREGTGLRQVRRLCSNLRPRGRLQERALTVVPFLVSHGQQLSRALVDAADPFAVAHGVLEL
jgi:uncharacterized protein YllA (UPF0747 family)